MGDNDKKRIALYTIFVGMIIFFVVRYSFDPIGFRDIEQSKILALLGSLLTVAGGSDGIHQLVKVYTNYMDTLAKRVKVQAG